VKRTREEIAANAASKIEETRMVRLAAEREAHAAVSRFHRVLHDYQDGKLAAEDWSEQRPQLVSERNAALAEADRLREREHEVGQQFHEEDKEIWDHLIALHQTIVGEVQTATGLDAVRAALMRVFDYFKLQEDGRVMPMVQPGAIDHKTIGTDAGPFRRVPLRTDTANTALAT
jgi:hypothetical protein